MKYSRIQKFLSAAMLLAFASPVCLSAPYYSSASNYDNNGQAIASTSLVGSIKLTDKNDKITLSLRDSDVKQVLRMFADKAGMNVVFHQSVEGKVTLDLVDMPINDAFSLVLQIAGLSYYKQNNTLIVLAKNSEDNAAFSKQEMMTFPIKYVSASNIANFLNKNVFGMKKAGMSSVDAATVNAATNELIVFGMPSDAAIVQKVIEQFDREPLQKTFVVSHTTPAEMADMICNFLLPSRGAGSSSSSGGGSFFAPPTPGVSTGAAAGIVTGGAASTSGDNLKLGEGVIACTVSQSMSGSSAPFDLQNLAISYYPQRGTISMIGGSAAQQEMVAKFIKDNDIKQPQAYLEMSIVELNEQGSKEFSNMWSIQSNAWGFKFGSNGVTGGRPGGVGKHWSDTTAYFWNNSQSPEYPIPIPGKDGTSATTPTFVAAEGKIPSLFHGRSYISWTMNYLIQNSKARVLASPKLLVTSGQESTIDLTQDYVEKVTSEFISSTSAGVGATGAVQRTYSIGKDKGIKIVMTPFISPEGYMTLNIKPEYATEAGRVYAASVSSEGDLQATLLSRRNLDLKNIRIKDGETLVIGGMVQEEDVKATNKIPVLGDLPLVGSVFRSSATTKVKTELVIMLTPQIINDGEGAVADSL